MTKQSSKSDRQAAEEGQTTQLDRLKAEIEALKAGWQRTQADFENFRRRSAQELGWKIKIGMAEELLTLISIAENLRRALSDETIKQNQIPDSIKQWLSGIDSIARQIDQILAKAGFSFIEPAAGEPFRPTEHEAIGHENHSKLPVDTVIKTVERGYRVDDRVLVPAKVIVSAGSKERD